MSSLVHKVIYPCTTLHQFLMDYMEGTLNPLMTFRFNLHLKMCSGCRKYLELYQKVSHAESLQQEFEPSEELLDATLKFLEKEGLT